MATQSRRRDVLLLLPWGALLVAVTLAADAPIRHAGFAWDTERKNVLSTVLYFAAALAYFRFDPPDAADTQSRRWGFYALAIVLFLAALLSKTVTCTLPVALLLMFWWKRGGRIGRVGG